MVCKTMQYLKQITLLTLRSVTKKNACDVARVKMMNNIVKTPWGYSNYFLTGCAARGLKPLPISKDFSSSKKKKKKKKKADLTVFSKFSQIRTHF